MESRATQGRKVVRSALTELIFYILLKSSQTVQFSTSGYRHASERTVWPISKALLFQQSYSIAGYWAGSSMGLLIHFRHTADGPKW